MGTLGYGNYKQTQARTGVRRDPCMTLSELARVKGVSPSAIYRKFKKTGGDVELSFSAKNCNYYPIPALSAWASANL